MIVKQLTDTSSLLAEGPLWCPQRQSIFWTDIKAKQICSHHLATQATKRYTVGDFVGAFAFTQSLNQLLVATKEGIGYFDLDTQKLDIISRPEVDLPQNRFNDGKCSSQGDFFVGSMDDGETLETGSLYVFDGATTKKLETNLEISNGLGFSNDLKTFYLTDSPKRLIYRYTYDHTTQTLKDKIIFATIDEEKGYPDGLCIDSEDHIWSAHWDGWCITRYKPDGDIDKIIELPVPRVSSCAFGGQDNTTLFVTTAAIGLDEATLQKAPASGSVFTIETGIKGQSYVQFDPKTKTPNA